MSSSFHAFAHSFAGSETTQYVKASTLACIAFIILFALILEMGHMIFREIAYGMHEHERAIVELELGIQPTDNLMEWVIEGDGSYQSVTVVGDYGSFAGKVAEAA